MAMLLTRRRALKLGGLGLAASGLVSASGLPLRAQDKTLKIALSNSFIGNKWRIEMENVFKGALQVEPYKSQVEGTWFNSGNDVSKQSQQLSNLIAERVDAILIDAASPTGLNGVLKQAMDRNILVISFDNTVTAEGALKIETDEFHFGVLGAEWLAKAMNGKGNVIMVTGVAGTLDDTERNKGADSVWAKHPDIKIVNRFTGMWDSATAERNTTAALPSLPQVDGIWCQGGTDGVLKAFLAANRDLPPTAGEAENGFRKFMVGYMGHKVKGISIGEPPFGSAVALELARRILRKEYPKKNVTLTFPVVTDETVKVGETVFPDLPDSFFDDFTDSGDQAVLKICVDAALDGKSCNSALAVNLPPA